MRTLKAGDKAPNFTSVNQNGEKISLKSLKGKRFILYFYPEDDTPGCTAQACNLRDNFDLLKKYNIEVFGISADSIEKHTNFIKKYKLPFTLLSDPQRKMIEAYEVWGEKNMYGKKFMGLLRTTYIIDEKGIIQKVFLKPNTKNHAEEIAKFCENFNW